MATTDVTTLARLALAAWRLHDAQVVEVSRSFNTVVHVVVGGRDLVLRISPAVGVHAPGSDAAEHALLEHLERRGVPAPRVHALPDGAASTTVDTPDGPVVCMLLDWVRGADVRRPVSTADAEDLGRLSAVLHDAAPSSADLPVGVLDGRDVLGFRVPDRLAGAGAHSATFLAARDAAQRALDALWASTTTPPRLLHGDLTPANVVRSPGGGLVPIDFQDVFWGHPEQDVAITLVRVLRDDAADGGTRCAAFRAGYASVRTWPLDPELEPHLLAARSVQLANLGLTLREPGLDEHLALHARALEPYVARLGSRRR